MIDKFRHAIINADMNEDPLERGEWVKCVASVIGMCHDTECPAFFGHFYKESHQCPCEITKCDEINEEVSCIRIRG